MTISPLRALSRQTLARWRTGLAATQLRDARVSGCGSLSTGLLTGPKTVAYSSCSLPLPDPYLFEVDVRIVLAVGCDPLDGAALAVVEQVTGARVARAGHIVRWGLSMPQASLYRHTPWSRDVSIEWDISVNTEPYFETAPWWSLAYTEPEIARQRTLRRAALTQNVPPAGYEALKTFDARELRWRLCSALASPETSLPPDGFRDLRTRFGDNPVLAASVHEAGHGRLPRPDPAAVTDLLRAGGVLIPPPEPPPPWVRRLERQCHGHIL